MEGARKGRKGREEGMVLVRELVRDWMGRDVRSTEDVTRSDLELVGILRKILLNASMAIEQVCHLCVCCEVLESCVCVCVCRSGALSSSGAHKQSQGS